MTQSSPSDRAVFGLRKALGVQAQWVTLALAPILAGAAPAHWDNGWMFGYENGGWEYPNNSALLAVVQFTLGGGAIALMRSYPISGNLVQELAS